MSGEALPLVWSGSLFDPFGYADEARAYLIALDRAGHPAAARDIRFTNDRVRLPSAHQQAVERALARTPEGEFVLVHHRIPGPGQPLHAEGPDVARTMFETDSVPRGVAAAPARGRRGVGAVRVQPRDLPARRDAGRPVARASRDDRLRPVRPRADRAAGRCRARAASPSSRTSTSPTARAGTCCSTPGATRSSPDDDVCLVLKCLGLHVPESEIRGRIDAYLAGRSTAPILLDTRFLPTADMPRLYAGADAFVLASRGEGWGRPYMEAMAMGLPTIGSRWSGNLDVHGRRELMARRRRGRRRRRERAEPHPVLPRPPLVSTPTGRRSPRRCVEVRRGGRRGRGEGRRGPDRPGRALRPGADREADRRADARELLERWRHRRSRGGDVRLARRLRLGPLARRRERRRSSSALEAGGGVVERTIQEIGSSPTVAVGVAQHWPPSFEPPQLGPVRPLPAVGVRPGAEALGRGDPDDGRRGVGAVEAARAAFVASGVAPELVHVVPNGDRPRRASRRRGRRARFRHEKSTVFLFVGGTTYRKGIDILLEAYGRAFTSDDDVCLVLKAFGARTLLPRPDRRRA